MGSVEVDATLHALIRERGRAEGVAWLDAAIAEGRDVRVVFPAVARQVGRGGLDAPGAALIAVTGDRVSLAAWCVDDAARVLLLRTASDRDPGGALALALELYRGGDARERVGALRALAFLPGADTSDVALPAIVDAMRMSQGDLFEAGVLDNAYAAVHLPQHDWRKAALKAIFVGHSIRRMVRLEARADAELSQSLLDLADEREAAGRTVPDELWPVAALHPPPRPHARLQAYLSSRQQGPT